MINEELLLKIKHTLRLFIKQKKIAVAFSGGVDSSFLAKLCQNLGYEITLLTIGFKNSHDILFSKKINTSFKLKHKIFEIDQNNFNDVVTIINKLKLCNLSWIENCIAFYYISKLAQNFDNNVVLTANGIDELFCGYDIYRNIFEQNPSQIKKLIDIKLNNEINMMKIAKKLSLKFNVRLINPFLSRDFIIHAKKIPLIYKIKSQNDFLRKHIIRDISYQIGVPKISAYKRKKAMQYGSLIHKNIIKNL